MKIINLPKWLQPEGEFQLIRLGRDHDGGYLVDARDVAQTDCLISLGVNDDWSFDEDFLRLHEVPLHAFDATVGRRALARKLLKSIALRNDVKHKFRAWREYNKFFTGPRHHHSEMVGLQLSPGFVSLQQIFTTYVPRGKPL